MAVDETKVKLREWLSKLETELAVVKINDPANAQKMLTLNKLIEMVETKLGVKKRPGRS